MVLSNFAHVLTFALIGVLFVAGGLIVPRLLRVRPNQPDPVKLSTYECGEVPLGNSWIQFDFRFYIIALVFAIFEVEIVFMFPWAVVFKEFGIVAFVEMMIFVAILLLGLIYVWRKGDLAWLKTTHL